MEGGTVLVLHRQREEEIFVVVRHDLEKGVDKSQKSMLYIHQDERGQSQFCSNLSRFRIGHIGNALVKRLGFDHQFGWLVATDSDLPRSMCGTSAKKKDESVNYTSI